MLDEWTFDGAVEQGVGDNDCGAGAGAGAGLGGEHVLLAVVGRYTAYAVDLGYLWRWEIYVEADCLVQEGGSLSLASATEAVGHVLAYFYSRDANTGWAAGGVPLP